MENIDLSTLFLDIILTATGFLLMPVLIRISAGKFSEKEAKKIAIINAVIIKLIFIIFFSSFNIAPALFWGYIGYSLLKESKNSKNNEGLICPHCKTKNKPHREYCYICGKKIATDVVSSAQDLNKEHIYCNYCGTKSNIKDKYCNNCGKKLKK